MSLDTRRLWLIPLPGPAGQAAEARVGLKRQGATAGEGLPPLAASILGWFAPSSQAVVFASHAAFFPLAADDLKRLLQDAWDRREPLNAYALLVGEAQALRRRLQADPAGMTNAKALPREFLLRLVTDPLNGWITVYARSVSLNRLLGMVAEECLSRGCRVDFDLPRHGGQPGEGGLPGPGQ